MTTTERDVRLLHGVAVLRGLRAEPTMRILLNRLADVVVRAVIKDRLDVIAKARGTLRRLSDKLAALGDVDDAILANALDGVIELLMPV